MPTEPRFHRRTRPIAAAEAPGAVGADGCVPVPEGPGLGVTYDWDLIASHRTALHSFP